MTLRYSPATDIKHLPGIIRRFTGWLPKFLTAALLAAGLLAAPLAHATITVTGAVDPADPSTWTSATEAYVGQGNSFGSVTVDGTGSSLSAGTLWVGYGNGGGTLDITNGGSIAVSGTTYISYYRGNNTLSLDGAGSSLTTAKIYLGNTSAATLNIFNGATVTATSELFCGNIGSTINFGSNGGILTVPSLPSSLPIAQYSGTGAIRTTGFIGDLGDLLVDATTTPTWTTAVTWNGTAYDGTTQNIAIQIDPMAGGNMAVGYQNTGSLTIRDGRTLSSATSYVGHLNGSAGTVIVDGAGSQWTNSGALYVGNSGTGTLSITNGAAVSNTSAAIGANIGSNGTVTVDGAGSTWTNSGSLTLGNAGFGRLNITNGGAVSVTGDTIVGPFGTINFGANGGTLTTGSIFVSASQLSGSGIINTSGIVGDIDLVFDSSYGGGTQSFTANGTTINLNLSSSSTLGVGNLGSGTLAIRDGVNITSSAGYLGYSSGSTGTATVTGSGSTWTNTGTLYVGNYGAGVLNIANGATVGNATAYLGYGYGTGANGTVTVDGAGSTWTNTGTLYVADSGTGTLNITNGAGVTTASAYVGHYSGSNGTVTVDGAGSTWTNTGTLYVGAAQDVGTGRLTITNGGTITTGTLFASASQLSGNGTINTSGIVGDMNLVFDSSRGATQSFTANGVTINLNQSSANALGAGNIGSGTLTIKDGVAVASGTGYLGYNTGSAGAATVTGPGSTWINTGALYVGNSGAGMLTVTDGGTVTDTSGYLGYNANSTGTTTVTGPGSTWTNSGKFYVGNSGTGILNIANGGTVTSSGGYLGYNTDAIGTAAVDGADSKWTSSSSLYVGYRGTGVLRLTNGGTVTNTAAYLGYYSDSTGTATVDGTGSTWTSTSTLCVGNSGSGTRTGYLSISDGGAATASTVKINAVSTMTADVGYGSSLKVGSTGTGTITNNGTVRLVTGAGASPGIYTPMFYGTLSGNTPQTLGGVWDGANHTVTVNAAAAGIAGTAATFDLASTQRVLFTDAATGNSVGAAFQATGSSTPLTITASAIADLSGLQSQLAAGTAVLSAWDFSITQGYTDGDPVYLSLFAGSDQSLSTLSLWHYDGSTWSAFTANDLAYDGTYASFTVTGFSGYAVSGTAPVPIPGAVWLLGSGLAGLVGMRRRLFRK
jgi:T5SS/PEP-CTERM-associated repeat protein